MPRQVFKSSGNKYWFDCDNCKHVFDNTLSHVNSGKWCPYCVNKKMCYEDECIDCYNKSFASHEKVICWSSKNTANPRHLFQGDSNRYWFNCNKCDLEFESVLYNIKTGYWCPFCNNKTEGKLYKIMKEIYPSIMYQLRVDWCKNVSYLPYDFCIPEYKIIIELDGPQHFIQIMDWKTPEEQNKTDKYKEKCANNNGYSIIRILQEDVLHDKYDWKIELVNNIENIKIDNIIQNIYMCKHNEYADFIN
jgi:very-short-patch-repair endonuclease